MERPGLAKALEFVRRGDTLVVWKLDRFGRSLRDLVESAVALKGRKVGFRSLQEALDTTSGGRLVFHVFAALAEFERDLIRERTQAGSRRRALAGEWVADHASSRAGASRSRSRSSTTRTTAPARSRRPSASRCRHCTATFTRRPSRRFRSADRQARDREESGFETAGGDENEDRTKMTTDAIATFFDQRAGTYDAIQGHQWMARRLVQVVAPQLGASVLDVATGTALAARAAARAVGMNGRVVGTDISRGMLQEARRKLAEEGIANVELLMAPADAQPFAGEAFDVVLCVSSIPFFPSVSAALGEWRRVLRPGGVVGFTAQAEDAITSHRVLRAVALREGAIVINDPNAEVGTNARCTAALERAGFEDMAITVETYAQPFAPAAAAWEGTLRHPLSARLRMLRADTLERVREAFLREYGPLYTSDAKDDVSVLFVRGRRP